MKVAYCCYYCNHFDKNHHYKLSEVGSLVSWVDVTATICIYNNTCMHIAPSQNSIDFYQQLYTQPFFLFSSSTIKPRNQHYYYFGYNFFFFWYNFLLLSFKLFFCLFVYGVKNYLWEAKIIFVEYGSPFINLEAFSLKRHTFRSLFLTQTLEIVALVVTCK